MVDASNKKEPNPAKPEPPEVDDLQRKALKTALTSERLEDSEKAANVYKLITESRKNVRDGQNQYRLLRFESYKSWAAILVPFISIVTLLVTIGMQYAQLSETREANADLQWRETVKSVLGQLSGGMLSSASLAKGARTSADPALAMALLKPYLWDKRHGKDATDLALLVLTRVPSSEVFQDYFASLNLHATWDNLSLVAGVDRNLWTQQWDLSKQLEPLSVDQRTADFRNTIHNVLLNDITFLGNNIAELLRTPRPTSQRKIDLRRVFLYESNFTNTDLSGVDLSSGRIESVTLNGAILRNVAGFETCDWVDTHWWDAKEISEPLLRHLIVKFYPYFNPSLAYESLPPPQAEYTQTVRKLCEVARISCEIIPYGKPDTSGNSPKDSSSK